MAGIWEYVHTMGDETQKRVNVSLLRTELMGVALGARTRVAALQNIEEDVFGPDSDPPDPEYGFDAATITDLGTIADEFDQGTVQSKLVYNAKVEFALNAGELNIIDETTFRGVVGI